MINQNTLINFINYLIQSANLVFKMGIGSSIKTSIGGKLDDSFPDEQVISINENQLCLKVGMV